MMRRRAEVAAREPCPAQAIRERHGASQRVRPAQDPQIAGGHCNPRSVDGGAFGDGEGGGRAWSRGTPRRYLRRAFREHEQQSLKSVKDGIAGADASLALMLATFTRPPPGEELPAREGIRPDWRQVTLAGSYCGGTRVVREHPTRVVLAARALGPGVRESAMGRRAWPLCG